jgi:hypothetical protein
MVHRRTVDGKEVIFGNHGALWGNAMTWFDHDTGTIWSQPLGEAIVGPLKGATLGVLPSTLTDWASWRNLHPDTKALVAPGEPTRFSLQQMSIVVVLGNDSAAYPVAELQNVVNDTVNGIPIAVVVDTDDGETWTVYSRTLDDGVVVELESAEVDELLDTVTGTTFHSSRGTGISGPLADQKLDQLPGFTSFAKDYFTFYPEGRLWSEK